MQQRRRVVHNLVQREQAEIDRHDLDYRPHPAERRADARAHEGGLGQRGIPDPLRAKFFQQPEADGETAAVAADILAHQEYAVILAQGPAQAARMASRQVVFAGSALVMTAPAVDEPGKRGHRL